MKRHVCKAETVKGIRRVLGCPSHETHGEHDWTRRGLVVHCYGWTAGREVWK